MLNTSATSCWMHSLRPATVVWLTLRLTIIAGPDRLRSTAKPSGADSRTPRVLQTKTNIQTSVRSRETSPSRKHRRSIVDTDSFSAHIIPSPFSAAAFSTSTLFLLRPSRLARCGCACFFQIPTLFGCAQSHAMSSFISTSAFSQKSHSLCSIGLRQQGQPRVAHSSGQRFRS
jgi:hypothetical protein